ncbi:MAG: glutaredoxin family protein [Bryobacteraceae bacterium]|nr:glutaredoxin family protein [Bryobacteraceae bacterium]
MAQILVYGADWCGMTRRTLKFLDDLGVEYKYTDIDNDQKAAEWVKEHADGKEKKPTVDVNGTVLVTPDDDELEEVLRAQNLLPAAS